MIPLIYDYDEPIYKDLGKIFNSLLQLDSIGFIKQEAVSIFGLKELPKKISLAYYDKTINIEFINEGGNELKVGHVLLTSIGEELYKICDSKPIKGFLEYITEYWRSKFKLNLT